MKKIILIVSLLFAIFFAGCSQVDLGKVDLSNVSEEDINKVIICNPPYMRYAAECCLDTDNNSICDRDEINSTLLNDSNSKEIINENLSENTIVKKEIDFEQYLYATNLPVNGGVESIIEENINYKQIENGIQVSKEIIITNNYQVGIVPGSIEIKLNNSNNNVILQNVNLTDSYGTSLKYEINGMAIQTTIFSPLLPGFEYKFNLTYDIVKGENIDYNEIITNNNDYTEIYIEIDNNDDSQEINYLDFRINGNSNTNYISYELNYIQNLNLSYFEVEIYYNNLLKDICKKELHYNSEVISEKITCQVQKYGEGQYEFKAKIYENSTMKNSIYNKGEIKISSQ